MDFEARERIWALIQSSNIPTQEQPNKLCKICAALEIFKLAICAGDCYECEDNLLTKLTETIPKEFLIPHLQALKDCIEAGFKLEELEKKIPLYINKQNSVIDSLYSKVEFLYSALEKLRIENQQLKDKVRLWQLNWTETQEAQEKVKNEIKEIKIFQVQLINVVQGYLDDSKILWDTVTEYMNTKDLEKKVSELDDKVIEEMMRVDRVWDEVKDVRIVQEGIQEKHEKSKEVGKHCVNLDQAVEKVLDFNFKAYDLQKIIETRLQELSDCLGIKQIERANEEYRIKVLELRKKTSECLLQSN